MHAVMHTFPSAVHTVMHTVGTTLPKAVHTVMHTVPSAVHMSKGMLQTIAAQVTNKK